MCMCFLFSDDEFSAAALLSEAARIKIHTQTAENFMRAKNKIYALETVLFHSSAVDTACDIVVY